ncbi:hypothetical protein ACLB2K_074655 [Fragaria x ananassa]
MGISCDDDDVVIIQQGKSPGHPTVVTVNCPDEPGLGCDLCRIVLQFGLCISKGDFTTDGRWCYIVLWVVPNESSMKVDWESLKERLLSACPSSCFYKVYLNIQTSAPSPSPVYLLKFWCFDQRGSLHDVTKVLCELEILIQRVKVMPTPDGRVLDLFFITDCLDLLHHKKGEIISIAEELFSYLPTDDKASSKALSPSSATLKNTSITVDDTLSPVHTLLKIQCVDQKGLFYDILRTSKDCNIQISYGRFSSTVKGIRNLELFIQHKDGKKILDPERQVALCSRLKEEMLHPLRVIVANKGPDTELLVANPVELSGKGRPLVFHDVTLALKKLGLSIFLAEIVRHATQDCQWDVYRFLLDDNHEFPLGGTEARNKIEQRVRRTLMGWFDLVVSNMSQSPSRSRRFRSSERASYRDAPYPRERRVNRNDFLCNKCKRPGHFARDCPNMTVCNNCGLPGHIAAECNSTATCWNCKEPGHLANQCSNDPVCHMCGKMGHLARDCSNPSLPSHDARLCNNCYKPGHIAVACTNEKACNNFRKPGHLARDCPNEPVCNICNISGHVARHYPKSDPDSNMGGGPFRDIICRNCGQPEHVSRECVSLVICNNCGGRGHLAYECPSALMHDRGMRRY